VSIAALDLSADAASLIAAAAVNKADRQAIITLLLLLGDVQSTIKSVSSNEEVHLQIKSQTRHDTSCAQRAELSSVQNLNLKILIPL
jgi:hypothetical protein